MKSLSCIIFTLALFFAASAQVGPVVHVDHLITYYKNPFSYLYFNSIYLSDGNDRETQYDLLVDSLINISPSRLIRITQEVLIQDHTDTVDLLIYRKSNAKLKVLQVVTEKEYYFITCERIVKDPCKCGSYLSLFLPQDKTLLNIERPFSFSLKRDLTNALRKHVNLSIDPNKYKNLCAMINYLQNN